MADNIEAAAQRGDFDDADAVTRVHAQRHPVEHDLRRELHLHFFTTE